MHRVPPEMTERARRLRRDSTPAERKLWRLLSRYRPAFTRQLVVGNYIIDLACREAKLAVELDGSQHIDQQDYDAARTAYLETNGWRVIRFWNSDVMSIPKAQRRPCWRTSPSASATPTPNPSLPGRGELDDHGRA